MATNTETIQFELVSPEEKLISRPVKHAVVPGTEGEMGVGAGHASFVVALKPGVVKLYMESLSEEPRRIFIAGGFADITARNCTVLAEEAVNVNDLDAAVLKQQIETLTGDLNTSEAAERAFVQRRLELLKAKLQAATGQIQF